MGDGWCDGGWVVSGGGAWWVVSGGWWVGVGGWWGVGWWCGE